MDKSQYQQIKIPKELPLVVQDAIKEGMSRKKEKKAVLLKKMVSTAAVVFLCFIVLLNLSPGIASAAYQVPVLGNLCRIFTFHEEQHEDSIKYIDVKIPNIDNTGKTELEKRVNLEIQKLVNDFVTESEARAKEYYNAFVATGGNPEDFTPVGIVVDYEVKRISEKYVSFVISSYETNFSAYYTQYYYNIDMETGRILTLKDWFGNDYQMVVAGSIEQNIAGWDEQKKELLWDDLCILDLISENTDFYINEQDEVVVVFEKYDIAVGAAGALEFTITPENEKLTQ